MSTTSHSQQPTPRAIGIREHLEFFDLNRDQAISIAETHRALQRLGLGYLLTIPGAVVIGLGVAGIGFLEGLSVDPAKMDIDRTSRVRHPDTGLVDSMGNFDDVRLNDVFARYGRTFDGEAMTFGELVVMISERVFENATSSTTNLLLFPIGITSTAAEWGALFWMASSTRVRMQVLEKETVRQFYTNPGFFTEVANLIAKERELRSRSIFGRMRNLVQEWLL